MKLHLPLFLRKSVLSCLALVAGCTLSSGTLAFADDLVLGAEDTLTIDYAAADSIPDLENGTLQLDGDTLLQLLNCGNGDGKTYTLATGISQLQDADGNAISLDTSNNAISNYFDSTRPGTGFWADATLQLSADGILRLVRHSEAVKAAVTISTRRYGSVDYQYYEDVRFADIEYTTRFSYAEGGAIVEYADSTITLRDNGSVVFEGNTASSSSYAALGGAIYGGSSSTITLSDNGSVTFSGNTAHSEDSYARSGAIYGYTITLSNNGSVTFSGNTASSSDSACGGAIYGDEDVTLSNNGSVVFEGNTASASSYSSSYSSAYGGAIYGDEDVTLSNNGSVVFEGNTASASYSSAYGGAIHGGGYGSTITLSDNGSVSFSGNTASASSDCSASGGAIYGYEDSTITLIDNGSVSFSGNTASSSDYYAYGGAIYGDEDSIITLIDNGSVVFEGNTASASSNYFAYGGAIYGYEDSTITLIDNGSVTFSGNTASSSYTARGGAIYTYGDLSIRNNDSVEFYQNAEVVNGNSYRLRSIYAYGGRGYEISLSAATGKSITFRDSVYISSGSTFKLNEAYEGKAQLGDIIFTGATTVDDLYTVKGNVAGTTGEIRLSRTSEVNTLTELYGGCLRVEEGAIYQGRGITAMEGSAATVRVQNATLNHSGYDLTFNAGTTLELAGANSISGNLNLLDGSTLHIDFAGNEFTTNLDGSPLALTGDAFLRLTGAGNGDGKTYTLFTGVTRLVDAAGNTITLDSSNNAISNYFDTTQPGTGFWADATLQLSADGILRLVRHSEAVKAAVTISTRRTGSVDYQYYEGVHFADIEYTSGSSYASGGAIYGGDGRTITLSDNGSVTFSGNTASASSNYYAYGGAIYGYEDRTITLSGNGSVSFSGNTASSSSYASGGAIYGASSSTITLSDNGSVTFSGNTASSSSSSYARGGAIYGASSSTITLSDNGSVTFSGNTASYGGAIYTYGDLSIRNNDSVEFYQNAEVVNGNSYRLRSIYAGGSGAKISLSAATGKSITFRDSVYIRSGSTFKLNEAYEGQAQLGDIIFTGATTVDDLYTVKGNVAGTAEEICLSRTSEINTLTKLYGGRLRVEEGAIYQGRGITAMEGSAATVRVQNATLNHSGYDLTFNAGSALEVAGNSTIRGNVKLLADSLFKMEQAATLSLHETLQADAAELTVQGTALLSSSSTLNASLTLADGATLDMMSLDAGAVTINGALTFGGQVAMGENLLAAVEALTCWEPGLVLFTGLTDLVLPVAASELESDRVLASSVFSNVEDSSLYVSYHVVDNVGSLMVMSVPEPTTTSLSLAALVALAMRRRRR